MIRDAGCGIRDAGYPAVEVARALYMRRGLDFAGDLREYQWPNGVIVDTGDCFGIAFATKTESGDWCWFVKVAVGELRKLLSLLPVPLPFISFCRWKTGQRAKTYRLDRLTHLTKVTKEHRGIQTNQCFVVNLGDLCERTIPIL